ncbi:hypothetical protein AAIR98_000122 [Elusimicrobium simillimum]|uniref:hypothetical protein n=1 Tax=Elusimicrobium simillimum TaxID=3143438 RepID=UPI003C6ED663
MKKAKRSILLTVVQQVRLVRQFYGWAITGIDAGNPNVDEDEFGGALIIDDPLDVGDANSEVVKEEVIRYTLTNSKPG